MKAFHILSADFEKMPFITAFARTIGRLDGWGRFMLAFGAGIFTTLALPPAYFLPALYIGFPVLCWLLIDVKTKKQAFLTGWFFSFGYLAASLYWISFALLVYSEKLWWVIPFASLGLPAALAIYGGLVSVALTFIKTGLGRALGLALFWWLGEWARGHFFTGFPWNLPGQSWGLSDSLIQLASVVGIYGVSLLALLSSCLVAAIPYLKGWYNRALIAAILLIPIGSYIYGYQRLSDVPIVEDITSGSGIGIRIVQANIPQKEKWQREYQLRNFESHLRLSQIDRPDWVELIIWPETAASFFIEDAQIALDRVKEMLGPELFLVTGAPRKVASDNDYQLFNGVVAINDLGKVVNSYDKSHLVPFGEYMPYKDILKLDKITHGKKDYSAGVGPRTLKLSKSIPAFSPLVCYEVIFPGEVTNDVQPPDWILNLTNDAWYGESAGPHQHKEITRIRAIEEGVPLVRSANTGMSVVFDAYGRTLADLGLNQKGVLDFRLPKVSLDTTLFSVYKHKLTWMIFFLFSLLLVLLERAFKPKN